MTYRLTFSTVIHARNADNPSLILTLELFHVLFVLFRIGYLIRVAIFVCIFLQIFESLVATWRDNGLDLSQFGINLGPDKASAKDDLIAGNPENFQNDLLRGIHFLQSRVSNHARKDDRIAQVGWISNESRWYQFSVHNDDVFSFCSLCHRLRKLFGEFSQQPTEPWPNTWKVLQPKTGSREAHIRVTIMNKMHHIDTVRLFVSSFLLCIHKDSVRTITLQLPPAIFNTHQKKISERQIKRRYI